MPPRPRKRSTESNLKQAAAVAPITGEWLKDLIRYQVLGESRASLPKDEVFRLLAQYLEHFRWLYAVRPTWEDRDLTARRSWEAIHFLVGSLTFFKQNQQANIVTLQGWERYGPVPPESLVARELDIASHMRTIERLGQACEALVALTTLDKETTPFQDQCTLMPRMNTSWHDYSFKLALRFIEAMEPTNPGLKFSNDGPVAKFVFHIIPSISNETVSSLGAVSKRLQRAAKELAATHSQGDNRTS